jgi:hypothetical protein
MRNSFARLALLGAIVCAWQAPASAQASVTATVQVRQGPLTITGPASLGLTFNDTNLFVDYVNAQSVTGNAFSAPANFVINDRRGRGSNGWRVQMAATAFTGAATSTTIAASNFSYAGGSGSVTKNNGPSDTTAPAEASGTVTLGSAATVASATSGNGRGRYTYVPAASGFSVNVPAGTIDDTYTSTLTISILAGP